MKSSIREKIPNNNDDMNVKKFYFSRIVYKLTVK